MGRLSTIEDVEKRQEAQAQRAQRVAEEPAKASAPAPASKSAEPQPAVKKSAAQAELEFHGLDNQEKRSAGHTALIVAAVLVVVAVALYFANYTLHFF